MSNFCHVLRGFIMFCVGVSIVEKSREGQNVCAPHEQRAPMCKL